MMNEKSFENLMLKVYDDHWGEERESMPPGEYERRRRDFAFHMTDWASDVDGLVKLYHEADTTGADEAAEFMIGFLYHVVPHLNAAGRLLLGEIGDPFAEDRAPAPGRAGAAKS